MKCVRARTNYEPLSWNKHGFDWCQLASVPEAGDGHCLFHCILDAYYEPYLTEKRRDEKLKIVKPVTKLQLVVALRKNIAAELSKPSTTVPYHSKWEVLGNGHVAELAKSDEQYTLQAMQTTLNSSACIGIDLLCHVSNEVKKNIWILDASTQDLYQSSMPTDHSDNIVVLYYPERKHFDLVVVYDRSHTCVSIFNSDHILIIFLKSRLVDLTSGRRRSD